MTLLRTGFAFSLTVFGADFPRILAMADDSTVESLSFDLAFPAGDTHEWYFLEVTSGG